MTDVITTLIAASSVVILTLGGMVWRLGTQIGSLSSSVSSLQLDMRELRNVTTTANNNVSVNATTAADSERLAHKERMDAAITNHTERLQIASYSHKKKRKKKGKNNRS
jgi:hypothetical protein